MTLRVHRWVGGALAVATFAATGLAAQSTNASSLRHGSGYLDTPAASVLPHGAIQGTWSGYWLDVNRSALIDGTGEVTGFGGPLEQFNQDLSVSVGFFDRVEVGGGILSLNEDNGGDNLFTVFGRLVLLQPEAQGFGLAVGGRYYNDPSFAGAEPNRLGYPDRRFTSTLPGTPDTNYSFYGVGTFFLRGFEASWFPKNDVTFSAGWGSGIFREGGDAEFYSAIDSDGWFAGSNMAIELAENTALNLISEWNGFELNFGAQVAHKGIRIGAHLLGANYQENVTAYRSQRFGLLASVGVCGTGFCTPSFLDRPEPEVIQLPAPAPDTVIVTREVAPAAPTGNPTNICLATGQSERVLITAQGDTLVGPDRVSIRTLRPGVVFAGTYADGRDWFTNDDDIRYENRNYSKSGNAVSLECSSIMRVGEHMGVPLFANRSAERPFETIYVPVRPGTWQAYQTLRGTRGD